MEIQKNSRQVPSTKKVCSNKLYSDTLYAYLQCISEWNEEENYRFVRKKELNFSTLAEAFDVCRQTLSTKFQRLIALDLVIEDKENGIYKLNRLPPKEAYLIPEKTLKELAAAFNERSISIYVYLFNRFFMNNFKPYEFTLGQLKDWVGITTKTRSNDFIITSILNILYTCGLIDYQIIEKVDDTTNFKNIKTIYQIINVNNELKTKQVQRIKSK